MAARTFLDTTAVAPTRRLRLTKDATFDWLKDSRKVPKRGDIKLNRTLEFYGLHEPRFLNELSEYVVRVVGIETGLHFDFTVDQLKKFDEGTRLSDYIFAMAALPGVPRTRRKKTLPGVPQTSRKSALPGIPRTPRKKGQPSSMEQPVPPAGGSNKR